MLSAGARWMEVRSSCRYLSVAPPGMGGSVEDLLFVGYYVRREEDSCLWTLIREHQTACGTEVEPDALDKTDFDSGNLLARLTA